MGLRVISEAASCAGAAPGARARAVAARRTAGRGRGGHEGSHQFCLAKVIAETARTGVLGREHRALLPARQVADVLAREVERAVRLGDRGVGSRARLVGPLGPAAADVGDLRPGDGDAVRDVLGEARMDPGGLLAHQGEPLGIAQRPEALADLVRPDVGAHHDALGLAEARGGIPELRDVGVGPGDAAVDLVVLLPEAPLGLERGLGRGDVVRGRDGARHLRREVGLDAAEHGEGDGDHHVVGLHRALRAQGVAVDDPRALARAADLRDLGAVLDHGPHALGEGARNHVHCRPRAASSSRPG